MIKEKRKFKCNECGKEVAVIGLCADCKSKEKEIKEDPFIFIDMED